MLLQAVNDQSPGSPLAFQGNEFTLMIDMTHVAVPCFISAPSTKLDIEVLDLANETTRPPRVHRFASLESKRYYEVTASNRTSSRSTAVDMDERASLFYGENGEKKPLPDV